MVDRHTGSFITCQPVTQLGSKTDFRSNHQNLSATFQHRADHGAVHLGLAASGDSVQQRATVRAQTFLQGLHGFTLVGIVRHISRDHREGRSRQSELGFNQPLPNQRLERGGGIAA